MLYTPVTKNAIRFCYNAHAGQLDKAGLPYVNHPLHLFQPSGKAFARSMKMPG